ncbi:hypothetical protein RvY_00194 [Ramazzottius varieornatus]|uniref:Wbp11/ELF5/Saf1 N-terminal domain-containing protein n=1 Tax=Ramazzottius varieornatus TaxID=947166 RepID=A0A1D1UBW1_RAMVA|nr:hypothetical protein RvY_00194 [Ramazzottius varieornatus]
MGKRSTTNTKSGRAMNPADQARKEARRRELKKNKKQRLIVREAVIKSKDPKKIIEELERLDQMEYNVAAPPPLGEHILAERRKRLLGNFNRCIGLYDKDDKVTHGELKRMLAGYHRKHDELKRYFDSVKKAENVEVTDIPLPAPGFEEEVSSPTEAPPSGQKQPQGPVVYGAPRYVSWEMFSDDLSDTNGKLPPGPPCCPPPSLSDDSDDEAAADTKEEHESNDGAESDDEDDAEDRARADKDEEDPSGTAEETKPSTSSAHDTSSVDTPSPFSQPGSAPPRPMFVPSQVQAGHFRQVPPPHMLAQRFRTSRPGPPGLPRPPPLMARPPPGFMGGIGPVMPGMRPPCPPPPYGAVPAPVAEPKATFAAAPQLRTSTSEVTRLIPTSVKVKREEAPKPKPKVTGTLGPDAELIPYRPAAAPKVSADQAYDAFLKEMQGLL